MRLLFDSETGEIVHVVPDRDWTLFENPTTVPLETFYIEEEIPANRAVCLDLLRVQGRADAEGRGKYYMQRNQAGEWELHEREGWEPFDPLREVIAGEEPLGNLRRLSE